MSDGGQAEYKGRHKKAQPSQRIYRGEQQGDRMRQAAGIILMILGALILVAYVVVLVDYDTNVHDPLFDISFMFCGAFLVTGGVFCLKKKGLELCLGSAFIAIFLTVGWFKVSYTSLTWLDWIYCILGTLPVILICLRIKEWQEIQGRLDLSTRQHLRGHA